MGWPRLTHWAGLSNRGGGRQESPPAPPPSHHGTHNCPDRSQSRKRMAQPRRFTMPRHELRSQQTGTGCKFTVVKIDVEQRRSERSILSQDGDGLGCHDWGGPMARMVTKEGPAPQPLLPSGGNGSVEESHDVSHHRPTALGCRSLQAICTGQGPAAACLQGPCTGPPPPKQGLRPGPAVNALANPTPLPLTQAFSSAIWMASWAWTPTSWPSSPRPRKQRCSWPPDARAR